MSKKTHAVPNMNDRRELTRRDPYQQTFGAELFSVVLNLLVAAVFVAFMAALSMREKSITENAAFLVFAGLILCCLLLGFYVFILDYAIKNLGVFLLLNLPFIGVAYIAIKIVSENLYFGIALLAYAVGLLIYSLFLRFRAENDAHKKTVTSVIVGMALFAILYFVAPSLSIRYFRRVLLLIAPIYCLGTIYLIQTEKVNYSLYVQNSEAMNQPIKATKRFNKKLFGIYIAISAVVLITIASLPFDDDVIRFGFLQSILRFLLGLFDWLAARFKGKDDGELDISPIELEESNAVDISEIGKTSTWKIWEILSYVLYVAVAIGIVVLIIYLIRKLIRAFYGRGRKEMVLDLDDDGIDEVSETVESVRISRRQERRERNNPSASERMRYEFFRKVKPHMDKEVNRSDSPAQIGEKLENEGVRDMLPLYEKARYSDESILDNEVDELLARTKQEVKK